MCSPSSLKNSRKDGNYKSLFLNRYKESGHSRQLYGSRPLRVSIGLDITNAGNNSPYYGVTTTRIQLKIRKGALPIEDKTIKYTHGLHGLSSM